MVALVAATGSSTPVVSAAVAVTLTFEKSGAALYRREDGERTVVALVAAAGSAPWSPW
jgi:hypothetical protein